MEAAMPKPRKKVFCGPCDEETGQLVPAIAMSQELGPLCKACAESYFPTVAADRRYAEQYAYACGYRD